MIAEYDWYEHYKRDCAESAKNGPPKPDIVMPTKTETSLNNRLDSKEEPKEEKKRESSYSHGGSSYTPNPSSWQSGSGYYSGYSASYKKEEADFLFVYGTLRKRCPLNIVVNRDGFVKNGKTKPEFKLVNVNDDYPAMATGGNVAIVGEVYNASKRTLKWLDSVEEVPTFFDRKIIELEDGTKVYAYIINSYKLPSHPDLIESGDWIEWKKGERARNKIRAIALQEYLREEAEKEKLAKERIANLRIPKFESENDPDELIRYFAGDKKEPAEKKQVHLSTLSDEQIKNMLEENGVDTANATPNQMRVECLRRWGAYYILRD